jgi:hypothetical protein
MKKSLLLSVIFLGLATANAQTGRYWSPAEKRAEVHFLRSMICIL